MVDFGAINWLAVAAGTVVNMVLGALWYSALFGKAWMAETGITMEQAQSNQGAARRGYMISTVVSFVLSLSLAVLIQMTGAGTVTEGLVVGGVVGLGIVLGTHLVNYVFERRSLKLFAINIGYPVVFLACLGAVLAVW